MRTVQSVTLEGVKTAVDLPVAAASDLAARVAQEHGVTITAVEDAQTANAAADLLRDIWRTPNGWPLPPEVFLALGHTGNYVGTDRSATRSNCTSGRGPSVRGSRRSVGPSTRCTNATRGSTSPSLAGNS